MNYLGKTLKKLIGSKSVMGVVRSYNLVSGNCEILYEGGYSEELGLSEVVSLLEEKITSVEHDGREIELAEKTPEIGRKPKKRRRAEDVNGESGNSSDSVANESADHETLENEFVVGGDLPGKVFKSNNEMNSNLNKEVNLDDNSVGGLNLNISVERNWEGNQCIDLNLNLEGDFDENCMGDETVGSCLETKKKECRFDLNFGVDEGSKDDCGGELKGSDASQMVEEIPKREMCGFGEETCAESIAQNGRLSGLRFDSIEVDSVKGVAGASDTNCVDEMYMTCSMVACEDGGDTGSSYKREISARKRGRPPGSLKPTKEPVLRRSARRGSAAFSTPTRSEAVNHSSSSPLISVASEEKPVNSGGKSHEELSVHQVKLNLPPSSQNLNIDGVSLLDIFSVYSCLRSFSYSLFLSPFELEDFVAALKCESSSSLVDCIHVSILQTLRKHLEFLSKEGSQSATSCLRSLDWSLLDLMTWPLFVAEYLLIHGSPLRPEFDLCRLQLLKCDYYKQPARVKVEILRCLCDDVIEVEVIRCELTRRSLVVDPGAGFDRYATPRMSKRRRATMEVHGGSSLSAEVDESADWNSDECCLCKMDGSLICCDGCPAAYHSRCVGVVSDLLPEGEWYCPECVIDKNKPWMKLQGSLRGADHLGNDPHGRSYYSSCGYLLVLESPDFDSSVNYYHRYDMKNIIEVLKSSDIRFGGILNAVSKHWNIPIHCRETNSFSFLQNQDSCSGVVAKEQNDVTFMSQSTLPPSGVCAVKDDIVYEKRGQGTLNVPGILGGSLVENTVNLLHTVYPKVDTELKSPMETAFDSENHGKTRPLGDSCLTSSNSDIKQGNNLESAVPACLSTPINTTRDSPEVDCSMPYVNCYSFALVASAVAEDIMLNASDKSNSNSVKSVEEIISAQRISISKKYSYFCWPNIPNANIHLQTENCGWCFSCRTPEDGKDCFLKMNDAGTLLGGCKSEAVDLQSKQNRKGHLVNVLCYILGLEDRLRGLLQGPWLNPHYSQHWRTSVLNATDVSSVKKSLLTLESNLNRRALSGEWFKHVDSFVTMGSASHFMSSSVRVVPKIGMGRKGSKNPDFDGAPVSKAVTGLTLYWWRGGSISRPLFNWKVLPRVLVRRAARKSGCTKVPGILYSESSEFAKRTKNVAWKAAVETSTSAEQFAFLVRDLDSNIRWDIIENKHNMGKNEEFKKSTRPFKKVVIRRKKVEGALVKYLLDFGKRKIIPDIVVKHGSVLEESLSGRKKFWLEESYVPLHLLKAFEERRIVRKVNKMNGKPVASGRVNKKPCRNKDFLYLFSKAEKCQKRQCAQCNKVVIIREAVSCQACQGFFHKKHIKIPACDITADFIYTCRKCRAPKNVKIYSKKGKEKSQFSKKSPEKAKPVQSSNKKTTDEDKRVLRPPNKKVLTEVPLRRSPRKLKIVMLQKKKAGRPKKNVKSKTKISAQKKKKGTSWQKKRTHIYRSYWLRGLLLSKKPNDERVLDFKIKKLIVPSEDPTLVLDSPKCSLCSEAGHTSTENYISCEICGDWFHGDAFGLNSVNMCNLIGFKCHACLKKVAPICPHLQGMRSDGTELGEAKSDRVLELSMGVPDAAQPPDEVDVKQPHFDENSQRVDESHREEEHSSNFPEQSVVLESTVEVEREHRPIAKKQKTG